MQHLVLDNEHQIICSGFASRKEEDSETVEPHAHSKMIVRCIGRMRALGSNIITPRFSLPYRSLSTFFRKECMVPKRKPTAAAMIQIKSTRSVFHASNRSPPTPLDIIPITKIRYTK